jgi:hypothetical protein
LSLVLRKKFAVKKEKTPKTNILIKSSFRTHSHMDDSILKYVAQADEVWHAGDIGDLSVTDSLMKTKPIGQFMEY